MNKQYVTSQERYSEDAPLQRPASQRSPTRRIELRPAQRPNTSSTFLKPGWRLIRSDPDTNNHEISRMLTTVGRPGSALKYLLQKDHQPCNSKTSGKHLTRVSRGRRDRAKNYDPQNAKALHCPTSIGSPRYNC